MDEIERIKMIAQYKEAMRPSNIIKAILRDQSFEDWLDLAESVEELEYCFKAFEEDEMYEYLPIIKNKIKSWKIN